MLGLLVGPDAPMRCSQRGQVVQALHVPHHLLLDGGEARHHAPHHGVPGYGALGHEPRVGGVLGPMLATLVRKGCTSWHAAILFLTSLKVKEKEKVGGLVRGNFDTL